MSSETLLSVAKSTNVRVSRTLRTIGRLLRILDSVAPRLAVRAAGSLFLTPRRLPCPRSEAAWDQAARRETRLVAGRPIVIRSWGQGRSILLVHGWEGRGTQLGAISTDLADSYRVVAPDLPAHGDSAGRQTNLLEFAAVVGALIVELGPVAIIAHSFGAAATNVALLTTPFDGRLVYIAPPEDFAFFTETFSDMLGISEELVKRMEREMERRFDIRWSELRGAALAPGMTVPLLVIHDEEDLDVPPRFGRALAAAWPGAELMMTRGLGHRRILRESAVLTAVRDFIERPFNPGRPDDPERRRGFQNQ